jgi:hypothetical protein
MVNSPTEKLAAMDDCPNNSPSTNSKSPCECEPLRNRLQLICLELSLKEKQIERLQQMLKKGDEDKKVKIQEDKRKDEYIRGLEEKVRTLDVMCNELKDSHTIYQKNIEALREKLKTVNVDRNEHRTYQDNVRNPEYTSPQSNDSINALRHNIVMERLASIQTQMHAEKMSSIQQQQAVLMSQHHAVNGMVHQQSPLGFANIVYPRNVSNFGGPQTYFPNLPGPTVWPTFPQQVMNRHINQEHLRNTRYNHSRSTSQTKNPTRRPTKEEMETTQKQSSRTQVQKNDANTGGIDVQRSCDESNTMQGASTEENPINVESQVTKSIVTYKNSKDVDTRDSKDATNSSKDSSNHKKKQLSRSRQDHPQTDSASRRSIGHNQTQSKNYRTRLFKKSI